MGLCPKLDCHWVGPYEVLDFTFAPLPKLTPCSSASCSKIAGVATSPQCGLRDREGLASETFYVTPRGQGPWVWGSVVTCNKCSICKIYQLNFLFKCGSVSVAKDKYTVG